MPEKEMSSLGIQTAPKYGREALKHGMWHMDMENGNKKGGVLQARGSCNIVIAC